MNATEPPPMKTAFDSLAEMCCKIVVSTRDSPFQWIYAVDDAWFHPEGWTLKIKEGETQKEARPLFGSEWSGENPVEVGTTMIQAPQGSGVQVVPAPKVDPSLPLPVAPASAAPARPGSLDALKEIVFNSGHGDANTARNLIRFIQERHAEGLNYGLCFCTFEYFWKNIAAIDQPQNAVFFDIRHALADGNNTINGNGLQGDLRDDWNKKLDATGLFAQSSGDKLGNYEMTRLGWYLHYSLKFGRIDPAGTAARCEVQDNHIQIISSAINPDRERKKSTAEEGSPPTPPSTAAGVTGRGPGVMSEYTEVQRAIWNALSNESGGPVALGGITPDRFTFSPIPKDDALETGLAIFNNSFKNAADWNAIKKLLLDDMQRVYSTTTNGNGHFNNADDANGFPWKWRSWLPTGFLKSITDPLYIKYEHNEGMRIDDLVRMLAHSGVREFPSRPVVAAEAPNRVVCIPTNPGIVFVFLLIEFVRNLGSDNARPPATVDYKISEDNKHFEFHISLENGGTQTLKEAYNSGQKADGSRCGGAARALRALGKNRKTDAWAYDSEFAESLLMRENENIQFCDHHPVISNPNGSNEIVIQLKIK